MLGDDKMAKAIRRVALLLTFSLLILTSTVGVASSQAGNWKYDADRQRPHRGLEPGAVGRYPLRSCRRRESGQRLATQASLRSCRVPANASGTEAVCESACNGYELTSSLDFENVRQLCLRRRVATPHGRHRRLGGIPLLAMFLYMRSEAIVRRQRVTPSRNLHIGRAWTRHQRRPNCLLHLTASDRSQHRS